MSAMPVSSHDDSTARMSPPLTRRPFTRPSDPGRDGAGAASTAARRRAIRSRIGGSRQRVGGHDQGVLAVVAVVARAEPDRPEPELLVEPPGRQVREPDLERRLVRAAVDGQVEEREQQSLADVLAAPLRVDRERDDVAPRRPSATSRRRPRSRRRPGPRGTGPAGWSRGRCGRPRAATARRSWRARWRGRPAGPSIRIGSISSLIGGRATTPPPRPRRVTPRGKVTYSGTSPARSSTSPRREAGRPEAEERGAEPARAASPRSSASAGARPSRSTATSRLAGARSGSWPAGQQFGRPPRPDEDPIRRAGRQQQDGGPARVPAASLVPASSASAVETPDDRQAEPVGQALGRRDPDAQAGERSRAGPDDDPGQPSSAGCSARPRNRPIVASSVSPWR